MAQDSLRDGFVQLCIDPSLNFYDGKCRVLIEGQMAADFGDGDAPATPDVVMALTSNRDLSEKFGAQSQIAAMIDMAFCICPSNIELYVLPRDPGDGAGTFAVWTLTVSAAPTAPGILDLFVQDGDNSISVPLQAGMTVTEVRDAILAEFTDLGGNLPFILASSDTDAITFTATAAGLVGNDLVFIENWRGRTDTFPTGLVLDFENVAATENTTLVGDRITELGDCCYSCIISSYADSTNQGDWAAYIDSAWDCSKPQCFGHVYLHTLGTLGQQLADWTNTGGISRYAHHTGDAGPGWMRATAYGVLSCCTACDNPELNIQGRSAGVLNCIRVPGDCSAGWPYQDRVDLMANGFVVMGPVGSTAGQYTYPYVYNDVTQYLYDDLGRANETFRDASSRRLATATAIALAERLSEFSSLGLFTKNTTIKQGTFGTNPRMMLASIRAWAKDRVGELFSEFEDIDRDISLLSDLDIAPACTGQPGKMYLAIQYAPPVRIKKVVTQLKPKLLTNCNR
jgi:phage tail sheath gpL-like